MRHVMLTCRYHPDLRWHCKSIAFTPSHGYNGARRIFFHGRYTPSGDLLWPYSKIDIDPDSGQRHLVCECTCPASDLILAPEDKDYGKDRITD